MGILPPFICLRNACFVLFQHVQQVLLSHFSVQQTQVFSTMEEIWQQMKNKPREGVLFFFFSSTTSADARLMCKHIKMCLRLLYDIGICFISQRVFPHSSTAYLQVLITTMQSAQCVRMLGLAWLLYDISHTRACYLSLSPALSLSLPPGSSQGHLINSVPS